MRALTAYSMFPGLIAILLAVVAVGDFSTPSILAIASEDAAKPSTDSDKLQRERRLVDMRKRAAGTIVQTQDDGRQYDLIDEPPVRYRDVPRGIVDGTIWAFGRHGRPRAILKVESYSGNDAAHAWLHSMCSLSEELIEAEWHDKHKWRSKQPGLTWKLIVDGPDPANTERGRTSQMKELIRRFAVTAVDPSRGRERHRLLAKPIHRYADSENGVDGAIFGFSTDGTNPGALILIEMRKKRD